MDIKVVDDEIMLSDGRVIRMPVKQTEEKEKEKSKGKIKVDKVPNVWGSSAGAGSDYFDLYRKQRNEENERIELMEKRWKEYTQNQIFQSKRKEKIEYIEKKSLKKKRKRQMKKEKIREMRNSKKGKVQGENQEITEQITNQTREDPSPRDCDISKNVNQAVSSQKKYQNRSSTSGEDEMVKSDKEESEEDKSDKMGTAHPVDTDTFLVVKEGEEELF
ncbi:conserved protein, unknown function [Plasmodium knowlesi strain H]|uniref:Uncharacterized protein n=2 Tax=Plasmodium knowlesi (strain H) TaxID=5851 RepID=A0A5K1UUQ8_PLAKH|nr:conserved protein, unknown function [Plasmodium knowlesi strain H]CAA9986973.1 conserved protein, unknown function [Plasmodium knowlesi strain H]SBO26599.1 conserved protein, unknown function [Plasmodium knowlesi strain H]SBO28179.1 conserved protein, unknown function [Plasmodium knowlesi strain H]VVS76447.1 conserved protein, unknown function [Plasmodium knowlesi strain H]|eukprot:XP_002258218.1 hypothetical protein, conserved in Plasmodium species [Plasmodium knowlesi strain H]